ncbi:MAG: hypothetical protein OET44_02135 [Gammaproteobacteria bacterium]|nr:hypothetical protein [Gammaproteobacteria bacterium]
MKHRTQIGFTLVELVVTLVWPPFCWVSVSRRSPILSATIA